MEDNHFYGGGNDPVNGYSPYGGQNLEKLVKEEVQRAQPKHRGLKALVLVLVGAILGSCFSVYLLKDRVFPSGSGDGVVSQQHSQVTIDLKEGESTVENAVAAKAISSIVGITTVSQTSSGSYSFNPFFWGIPRTPSESTSVGSGVIVSQDGYILTNSHVVADGEAKSVTVRLASGEEIPAKLMWNDSVLDLAVVKVDKQGLPAIEFGDSDKVQIGDRAIAIGNPLGLDLQSTLTSGVISGLDRSITLENNNVMDGLIQTDAAINPGNSGGALLNAKGELIGINTAKPQTSEGIGFAIPISVAQPVVAKIVKSGEYQPVYLGISGYNAALAQQLGRDKLPTNKGIIIQEVSDGSPASKAGLRAGDIIVALDGKEVDSMNSLKKILVGFEAGNKTSIVYYRGQEKKEAEIEFTSFDFPVKAN